ncbi:hypothetical protein CU098_002627, partial [Rhizopus stolonifer]
STTQQLKEKIFQLTSIPVDQQVLRTVSGYDLQQFPSGDVHLSLSARLLGGKGGFGSMLRAQGGRMNAQKTTNFEACRDLQGRRIRTVNESKKLQQELEAIPEREKEKRENLKRKIDKALKEREPKKYLFDDNQFLQNAEEMVDQVKSAVSDAIKRQKTSHTPAAAAASSSKSMFDDDVSSSEEEDDDDEEEKEEEEKEEDDDDDDDDDEREKEAEVVVVSDTKGKGKQKA